jgi:hypothetical protein
MFAVVPPGYCHGYCQPVGGHERFLGLTFVIYTLVEVIFVLPCPVLHRIAFPVVSEWYQQRHSFFTILLTRARIRSTLSTSLTTPPYS